MKGKIDIERLLMRVRIEIDPRVRRAVLSRYSRRYGDAHGSTRTIRFWRRPVPLYLAASFVLAVAGISFIGGRKSPRTEQAAQLPAAASRDSVAVAAYEQQWRFTQRDAL